MVELVRKYPGILIFCFLSVLFSGPGQTYVISYFIRAIETDFGLSSTHLGMLYGIATVAGAFLLPYFLSKDRLNIYCLRKSRSKTTEDGQIPYYFYPFVLAASSSTTECRSFEDDNGDIIQAEGSTRCFYMGKWPKTWFDARQKCQEKGE